MALAFSTTDKSATIAISGTGDTIATNTGTVTPKAVRGAISKSAGKWVFALTCTAMATSNDMAVGLATASHPLTTRLEESTASFRYDTDGEVTYNSSIVADLGEWGAGDKLYVAVDFADGFWIKVNSGPWNNDPSADPETGAGDISLGGLNGLTLFPIASFWNSDGVWTLDPSAAGHGLSSFSVWDTTVQTLAPPLFINGSTIQGPTVTPGAVSLTPPTIADSSVLYGPTVSQGALILGPPLLANASAIYATTAVPGGVMLSPGQLTNSPTIYTAAMVAGTVTLSLNLLINTSMVHAPAASLLSGDQSLTAGRLENISTFFQPTLTRPSLQTLSPAWLSNVSAFYLAAATQPDPPRTYPLAIQGGGSVIRGRLAGGGVVAAGSIPSTGRVIATALGGRP